MKLYFYILDNDREFNPETRTFGDPVFKVRVEECEVIEKPKKVERYIRCRKCGGNMEWSRDFPPQIKCTRCGYTVYPQPYEPDCIKLPETWEEYFELYEKIRRRNG